MNFTFPFSFFLFVFLTSFLSPMTSMASITKYSFLDLTHPKTRNIEVAPKSYKGVTDYYFRDLWGREVLMRGWNVSGKAKNGDYLSFKNADDAEKFLEDQKAKVGTNVLRWMFQWPGVEKKFREYDDSYLKEQVKQMKKAIKLGMYIFVDFHQDAFSKSIKDGYNGTPEFVVDWMKVKHKDEGCWLLRLGKMRVKCFVWSMSYFFNRGVKDANTKFWNNSDLHTPQNGKVPVWDVYTDMIEYTLKYIKNNLTKEEFSYIIGLDPYNEPANGTNKRKDTKDFVNNKLFKFYRKLKKRMEEVGWEDKLMFSEPVVFWNVSLRALGAVDLAVKPLGYGHLEESPGDGWVWNAHFYDEKRQGLIRKKIVKNGGYLENYDSIRKAARLYEIPPFVSEFGIPLYPKPEISDVNRRVKATYQALDFGKPKGIIIRKGLGKRKKLFADTFGNKIKSRYVDFYSLSLSGTKWEWSPDKANWKNNKNKDLKTPEGFLGISGGALTKFATPKDYLKSTHKAFERGYIKRTAGELYNSYYNDNVKDSFKNRKLDWVSLKPDPKGKEYFVDQKYFYAHWKAKRLGVPSEIFIPRHFKKKETYLITHDGVWNFKNLESKPSLIDHFVLKGISQNGDSGNRLFIHNSFAGNSNIKGETHFALIVSFEKEKKKVFLEKLRSQIINRLNQRKSPLYMNGDILVEKAKTFNVRE